METRQVLDAVPASDILDALELDEDKRKRNGPQRRFHCPFPDHPDEDASFSVNVETKLYHCFGCGKSGDLLSLVAFITGQSRHAVVTHYAREYGVVKEKPISPAIVDREHGQLLQSRKFLQVLTKVKGLDLPTIKQYRLGLDKNRVSIPIPSEITGSFVNIRRYDPFAKRSADKMKNVDGHGGKQLYPADQLKYEELILTEGELKALLLIKEGFHAVSPTGGVSTWEAGWSQYWADKDAVICFDVDKAGCRNALKRAQALYAVARSVKVVQLPIDPEEIKGGDVTNYFVDLSQSAGDFRKLIDDTPAWSPQVGTQVEFDNTLHNVHLSRSTNAQFHNKRVEVRAVISAKATSPFIVPRRAVINCTRDSKVCGLCPVYGMKDEMPEIEINEEDPRVLELIGVTRMRQALALREVLGIPKKCMTSSVEIQETMNVEDVRLIPQLEISHDGADDQHAVLRAFYVGHGIETNVNFTLRGRAVSDPNTQQATLLISEAEPNVDNLTTFKLDTAMAKDLEVFQPAKWTVEAVEAKLLDVIGDLSANVTRIYQRPDLHLFMDVVWHSPLYLTFDGKRQKGWMEGLVIGDPGQGKSEVSSRLRDFYGLGEKIDTKGASAVGLCGGLQETNRQWYITWGVIPLNDRRLVILEEIKGMPVEVIAKLTDMRSSGIVEVTKVEKRKTNARARLIWISNPRSERQVSTYNFGSEIVKELIGSLEDIRRFDMAMIVASGEVPMSILNMPEGERPAVKPTYTQEKCRNLVLWAWSRTAKQVNFEMSAQAEVLSKASEMGKKYSSKVPLVEPADQRLKLARVSAAIAARTFSHGRSPNSILVRQCHVMAAFNFLCRLYDSPHFAYDEFSRLDTTGLELRDKDYVGERLLQTPYPRDLVEALLHTGMIGLIDFVDWTGQDREEIRELVSMLVRKNALKRKGRGYVKTPAFIEYLKVLVTRDLDAGINEVSNAAEKFEDREY